MKRIGLAIAAFCLVVGICSVPASAQAPSPKSLRGQLLGEATDMGNQIVQLAEATPAEKFSWRPGKGVRSIGEVYMHIAEVNFDIASFVGLPRPADFPNNPETAVTQKAQVVDWVKKSIAQAKAAIEKTSDADLMKATKFYGQDSNYQAALLGIVGHMHEHLGQAIAYARVNGITPPWSRESGQ